MTAQKTKIVRLCCMEGDILTQTVNQNLDLFVKDMQLDIQVRQIFNPIYK